MLKAKDIWYIKHAKEEIVPQPCMFPLINWVTLNFLLTLKSDFMESARDPLPKNEIATRHFENDFLAFRKFMTEMKNVAYNDKINYVIQQDIDEDTEIPHTLLDGPWNIEKELYLFWFLKSGAKLEWIHGFTGEVRLPYILIFIHTNEMRRLLKTD